MKKKLVSVFLSVLLLLTCLSGVSVSADETPVPSATVYVNGYWQSAKVLTDLAGDRWVEFPIDGSVLVENDTNYVRITTNVINGTTPDTQVQQMLSVCGWSNSFTSDWIWCDAQFTSLEDRNPDVAIEGWNGSQWIRIHNDHDCVADASGIVGTNAAGTWQSYARNIWTDANVLKGYKNFRVVAHLKIGENLTASAENAPLFPESHYYDCTFCPDCGGCLSASCGLNHKPCTCGSDVPPSEDTDASLVVYVNGNWTNARYLRGLSGDLWLPVPIDGSKLIENTDNYVRVTTNVLNSTTENTQVRLFMSNCGWSNTFSSDWIWVDSQFTFLETYNADVTIEGWNGERWMRVHNDNENTGDFSKPLGRLSDGKDQNYARNIWISTGELQGYSNYRVMVHLNIGTNLSTHTYNAPLFPESMYHDCELCEDCGGCKSTNCTLGHTCCVCSGDCGHQNKELRNAVEPTCTEEGNSGDIVCADCGAQLGTGTVLPALGHEWRQSGAYSAPSCTEGASVDYVCAYCGETKTEQIEALGHSYEIEILEAPTEAEAGSARFTCTVCGDTYTGEPGKAACPSADYTDVPAYGNWAHAGIDFCIDRGIMGSTRTDALTFEPATVCTRSMIVSLMYRLTGSPKVTYEARFPDVKQGQWYTDAVIWAADTGVVAGYGDGTFGPNDKITREQMAVILKNYTETVLDGNTEKTAALSGFADESKVTWSKAAVSWAVAEGLISGKSSGDKLLLDPQGNATRMEAASLLMRYIEKFVGTEPAPVDEPLTLLPYDSYDVQAYTAPLTEGTVVYNETAFPVCGQDGSLPVISLLYPVESVISLRSYQLDTEYVEGKDYKVEDGKIVLLEGTAIPYRTHRQMFPQNGDGIPAYSDGNGGFVYSVEGKEFIAQQIAVTYTHSEDASYDGFVQPYLGSSLPNTVKKLADREALHITFIGDSITYGLNTSGIVNIAPFTECWPTMICRALNETYGQKVTWDNLGICGTTAAWGVGQMANVIATDPDLLVIAFGMNDGAGNLSAAEFTANLQSMISAMKTADPDCEILLVSTTLPNEKIPEAYRTQPTYEAAMEALTGEGVGLVKMTSVHADLLKVKNFYDMSGSNLNHPNDFLARVYAQSVLSALIEKPAAAEGTCAEKQIVAPAYTRSIPAKPATKTDPTLLVLVNERTWVRVDLTPYAGQTDTWVEVPLNMKDLRSGINQFALDSNVKNGGNLTPDSLNVYSTANLMGYADSFITTNNMVYWNVMHGKALNIKLQLFDGAKWTDAEDITFANNGGSVVIGTYKPDGYTYQEGRNICVESLDGFISARLLINAYVGQNIK